MKHAYIGPAISKILELRGISFFDAFQKEWFTTTSVGIFGEHTIDEWNVSALGDKPTDDDLLALCRELENEKYKSDRERIYPSTHDMVIAIWHDIYDHEPERRRALQTIRAAVKLKIPKP